MIRVYRYPLHPTKEQEATLVMWLRRCCELYNAALEQRRDAWRRQGLTPSLYGQVVELTDLRRSDQEWSSVPVEVERSALRRIQRAFDGFFRRIKSGDKPGYPRFRSRDRYDSFSFPKVRLDGPRVDIPKLGLVKFKRYREPVGSIREATIRRCADRWWLCLSCDLGEAPPRVAVRNAVGIDLGLTSFAVLSDGSTVNNPRHFRASEARLSRRQKALASKRRGSNSRRSARTLVARAHLHIKNQRRDFSWKLANELVRKYDLIAHEDLQIARMVRGNLAKSIHDAAWGEFLHCLKCKAEDAGKTVVAVDPRGTTQNCSGCGARVPKTLSQRVHSCECGVVLSRDHNAALNVLALGRSGVEVMAEGVSV